jgi:hypothetical protein
VAGEAHTLQPRGYSDGHHSASAECSGPNANDYWRGGGDSRSTRTSASALTFRARAGLRKRQAPSGC